MLTYNNIPILDEYKTNKELHEEFCIKVKSLVTDILKQQRVNFHSIDSRVKEEESLVTKVENSNGKYHSLSDITDISGLRIITYFSEDVDKIASILHDEFLVDENNSVDKRIKLDPDRFGYLSLHYIVQFSENRLQLPEYQRFTGLKVEIQIRSILQHAWAEIEHDLGYKSKQSIPRVVRRNFSRLAGLLELADEEFDKIRKNLEDYNTNIKEEIKSTPSSVLIDKITIKEIIEDKQSIASLIDYEICKNIDFYRTTTKNSDKYIDTIVQGLKLLGLNTIDEVLKSLEFHKDSIIKYASEMLINEYDRSVLPGISIFYLSYVKLGKEGNKNRLLRYLKNLNIDTEDMNTFIDKTINYFND
jgi:putative GTP pyrophosphokinase